MAMPNLSDIMKAAMDYAGSSVDAGIKALNEPQNNNVNAAPANANVVPAYVNPYKGRTPQSGFEYMYRNIIGRDAYDQKMEEEASQYDSAKQQAYKKAAAEKENENKSKLTPAGERELALYRSSSPLIASLTNGLEDKGSGKPAWTGSSDIGQVGEFKNQFNDADWANSFFALHPEYAGYKDRLDDLFAEMQMNPIEDVWRDVYGYGDQGLSGVKGWDNRMRYEGIDPLAEDAWEQTWNLIHGTKGFSDADLFSDATSSLGKFGSAYDLNNIMRALATSDFVDRYGDIASGNNFINAYNGEGYPIDANDYGAFRLQSAINSGMYNNLSLDDRLALANYVLQNTGDNLMLGLENGSGLFDLADANKRTNTKPYSLTAKDMANLVPYEGLYDQDAIDAWIAYANAAVPGGEKKVGTKAREK
jgi:hypothetical protein